MNAWYVLAFLAGAATAHSLTRAYRTAIAWITRHTPPPRATETPHPDPADTHCGTDTQLLAQCRDLWRNSPEGDQ